MSSKFRFEETEVAGSGTNFIGIAGEALTNRELVRIGAAGTLVAADASVAATLPAMGLTLAAASVGQHVLVLLKGWVGLSTWTWTAGGRIYTSDVAGVLTQTAGTVIQEVGIASSATQIWFDPQGLDTSAGAVGAHILATTGPHTNTLPLTDLAVGVQGEIIHRGAADWAALGVGAAGLVLTAGGAGADVAWAAAGGGVSASTTRTITAGNLTCGGWNHAQNSSDVCATPLDEPNSFHWMTIDDANNITMHIASADLENNHTFRVLVF